MKVNWENIKYIFQIPLWWYQGINNKVEHAYGQNFISLREGYNGGLEIGVDEDMFSTYIQQYITGGTVKSVDGVLPDDNGNVVLNAVRTINGESPDNEGNFEFPAVMSVNDITPDENGNVSIETGSVESVDNIRPDDNGNVVLNAIQTSDVGDVGIIAGLDYEGEYSVAPMAHGHKVSDLDDIQDEQGNWMFIKSINTILKPDDSGNVNIPLPSGEGYLVVSVDGVKATDEKGNVDLKAVRSIQTGDREEDKHFPDENGNIKLDEIEGKVKTVNQIEPDDDGNIDLGNIVYSVNDVAADADGNVVLDIPTKLSDLPNDAGYTTTTNVQNIIGERLVTLTHEDITDWASATYSFLDVLDVADLGVIAGPNYEGEKTVCPVNHNHKFDELVDWEDTLNEKYVTLGTAQTITGEKTFTQAILVSSDGGTSNGVEVRPSGSIGIHDIGNDGGLRFFDPSSSTDSGGVVNQTSGITVYSKKNLNLASNPDTQTNILQLTAPQDHSVLFNSPSDDCEVPNAIATVGWVRKNGGTLKSVNGKTPDENGNVDVGTVRSVNGNTPDANGNVEIEAGEGSVKSVDNISPDSSGNINLGAVTTTKVETAGQIVGLDYSSTRYVCNVNHGHMSDDIADWDDATSSFVKSVDGHSPNTSGEVSFGLAGSKFVKTDGNGHLTTTNDKVITVGSSDSPVNGTYTVVKSVTWSSPNIVIARDQWKFVNGVLVSVKAMANATIGTTVYTGS